jgi:hypothetical protein
MPQVAFAGVWSPGDRTRRAALCAFLNTLGRFETVNDGRRGSGPAADADVQRPSSLNASGLSVDGRSSTLSRHTGLTEAAVQNRRSRLSAHRRVFWAPDHPGRAMTAKPFQTKLVAVAALKAGRTSITGAAIQRPVRHTPVDDMRAAAWRAEHRHEPMVGKREQSAAMVRMYLAARARRRARRRR